jgi:hypothetical protein
MATVNLLWDTQDEVIPNAATFTTFAVALLTADGATVVQAGTEPLTSTEHTFLNVDPGNYLAQVSLIDGQGNQAQPPISSPFTVPTQPTAPVPVSVSVALS